ncbi:MAG: hypothetical protein ACLR8Y_06905 [Alistipes indistinctus]
MMPVGTRGYRFCGLIGMIGATDSFTSLSAEQDTSADFVGLDFTAIDSGGEGNEGNLEECGNLFAGQVTLCLLSSGDRLHLLHLFMHGFPDQVGKLFNGQAVQNQVFFHSG